MIVIVGHGPSINSGLGSVIDTMPVVRLKRLPTGDAKDWGTRTDFLCARSLVYRTGNTPFWHFNDEPKWLNYFRAYSQAKPSTGLCAVFCAIDRGYTDIALIGFDAVLHGREGKRVFAHDKYAEQQALRDLKINVTELSKSNVEIHRPKQHDGNGDVGGLDLRRPSSTISLPPGRRARARSGQSRTQ